MPYAKDFVKVLPYPWIQNDHNTKLLTYDLIQKQSFLYKKLLSNYVPKYTVNLITNLQWEVCFLTYTLVWYTESQAV